MNTTIPKLIYITGIDGSGKSTVSEHLAKMLRNRGYNVDILWLRFNHVLSKPLLGLCRLLGYTKYETHDGIRVGYHDFHKSSLISNAFIILQYLDAIRVKYLHIIPRYKKKNAIIILDRYVYDILIDIAVDTKKAHLLSSAVGSKFKSILPGNSRTILVRRNLSDVLEARPEGKVDRNFESRFNHYEELANENNLCVVDNNGSLEALLTAVNKITGLADEI
jgi:thymidylate kinase